MTKATQTLGFGVAVLAVYVSLYAGIIPTGETFQSQIVPVLPFWALVAFGSYALGTLGWGVYSFNDKEAEYHTLLKVSQCFITV